MPFTTQPARSVADNGRMISVLDPEPNLEAFYAALWIAALALDLGAIADPFPDEELATSFFKKFRPVAKA